MREKSDPYRKWCRMSEEVCARCQGREDAPTRDSSAERTRESANEEDSRNTPTTSVSQTGNLHVYFLTVTPKPIMKSPGTRARSPPRVGPFSVRFREDTVEPRPRRRRRRIHENLRKCRAFFESPVVRLLACIVFGILLPCTLLYVSVLLYHSDLETKKMEEKVT